MIVERALNKQYLSNSFVVGDEPGGSCVIIDAGGPAEPLTDFIAENELKVTHLLCTHHHVDHVSFNDFFVQKYACPVVVPAAEADLFQGKTYCVVPSAGVSQQAVGEVTTMIEAIGAIPYFIGVEEHDSFVAAASHLPFLLSTALVGCTSKSANCEDIAAAPTAHTDSEPRKPHWRIFMSLFCGHFLRLRTDARMDGRTDGT